MPKALWIVLLTFAAMLLVVLGYVAYVFLTYSRIEDKQDIEVEGNSSSVVKLGEEYTIVTFNLGFGAYTPDFTFFMDGGDDSRAKSEESVRECINGAIGVTKGFSPDFVLYQEVDTDSTRSYHVDEAAMIKESFKDFDHAFACNYHSAYLMYPIFEPHGASNSGILTESRFDIKSSLRRSLPIATGFKKILDLDRCYSISRIAVDDDRELVLINTHLSAYGTDESQGNAQLEMIFEDMKAEYDKGNYVICGGDFNHDFTGNSRDLLNPDDDTEYSWCKPFPEKNIPNGFIKCDEYDNGLVSTTRNTNIPYCEDSFTVVLDGFLISDNISCEYVQNMDCGYEFTDHNPVVMKFMLME